jgi:hypothetical protein
MAVIRFATESYLHNSRPLSAQRLINAYAERQPKNAKVDVAVFGVPGLSTFATIGSGPIRALFEMNGVGYAVSGGSFYSFDSAGVSVLLGTGITGASPVSVDGNGLEIVIRNGANGFSYIVASGNFAQISDVDFQQGYTVTVLNNIFCFDWLNTNKFFTSAVLDGRVYDPLDFASAESDPDFVRAVRAHNGTLFILGAKTIEPWDNTGAADFAFSRIKGGTIDRGIIAPLAIENEDSSLFILGEDLIAYRINGLQLQRISTHALEREWAAYATVSDVFCFKISVGGHKFIYFTFPTESRTFAYDIATGLWHERISYDAGGLEVRWRANCAVIVYNKTLVGDANSGKLGLVDPEVYTEFGDPIISTLTSPPLYLDGKNISVPVLEVDMESGVGLASGQGSDPQVMLDWSVDGGRTYLAPQEWASFGEIGNHQRRVIFNGLGEGYEFTFRLRISDPVKRVVYAARVPGLFAAR